MLTVRKPAAINCPLCDGLHLFAGQCGKLRGICRALWRCCSAPAARSTAPPMGLHALRAAIPAAGGDSLSERQSLFARQIRAWPHTVLRSDSVRLESAILLDLPQSGSVVGRRPAARDRRKPDPARLRLRTPTLLNVAWTPKLGWDGHFPRLEGVAIGPITATDNMNLPEQTMIERLSAMPGYVERVRCRFRQRRRHHAQDRAGAGDVRTRRSCRTMRRSTVGSTAIEAAIGAAAKRGFALFNGKANCAACHSGWAFTDASFHDIGVAQERRYRARPAVSDLGEIEIRLQDADLARRGAPRAVYARRLAVRRSRT